MDAIRERGNIGVGRTLDRKSGEPSCITLQAQARLLRLKLPISGMRSSKWSASLITTGFLYTFLRLAGDILGKLRRCKAL